MLNWNFAISFRKFTKLPSLYRQAKHLQNDFFLVRRVLKAKKIFGAKKTGGLNQRHWTLSSWWSTTVFLKLLGFKSRLRTILWVSVPVNQELSKLCYKLWCMFFLFKVPLKSSPTSKYLLVGLHNKFKIFSG